jgi:hypothetical protein
MWSILLFLLITNPCITLPQKTSSESAQEKIRAERVADRFVDTFRRRLDFGVAWKTFRMSDPSCTHRANGVLGERDYERLKLGGRTVEKVYIAVMNFYYLMAVYELSFERLDSQSDSAKAKTPGRVELIEKRSKFFQNDDREPQNAREVEELISTLEQLAAEYRKHLPKRVMKSSVWRANQKYLIARNGKDHADTLNGNETFCVPERSKVYVVDRGIFYFYIVEERGKMKVAGLGID